MKTTPLKIGAGLCLALGMTTAASAALVIDAGSIVDNTYSYSLNFTDTAQYTAATSKVADAPWTATGNKFVDDVLSFSNIHMTVFNGGTRSSVSLINGATDGEFVYKFDFTDLNYTVNSFTISELVRREQDGTWTTSDQRNLTGFTSWYSTDGTNWSLLHQVNPAKTYLGQTTFTDTVPLAETTSIVYYKVVLSSSGPLAGSYTGESNNGHTGVNWNYTTNTSTTSGFFTASFDLATIPEPSAWAALLGGAGLLTAMILRRRRYQ
ncbi:PEP-CTERM putative exosortase interaction domain-containing protein [Opitutaceae bacterium TAV1]|nr:PEP-CTERM putative exosortase interaction domain-containing protein [Opitutaceae bacterium TAV1]